MSEIIREDVGLLMISRREELELDTLLEARELQGELLKHSRKSTVWRVDDLVLKSCGFDRGRGFLQHTFNRIETRRAWYAALRLEEAGVAVARPLAWIEIGWAGMCWGHTFVCAYLEGCENVERYGRALHEQGADAETVSAYLANLADAVNGLTDAGAFHADLSGKNIFTADGDTFYFIDLDSVEFPPDYDVAMRLKNHVQLYDSFCDWWGDEFLAPFLERMLPEDAVAPTWRADVREAQAVRRARTEAVWESRGEDGHKAGDSSHAG